ncbi:MAG TPA: hypothetical protein VEX13_13520 [Chloroflexia bacterium]|nr:hypothetical protein [Chloroflexia bacterium]
MLNDIKAVPVLSQKAGAVSRWREFGRQLLHAWQRVTYRFRARSPLVHLPGAL